MSAMPLNRKRLLFLLPLSFSVWYFWSVAFTGFGNDFLFLLALLISWPIAALNQTPGRLGGFGRFGVAILSAAVCLAMTQFLKTPARKLAVQLFSSQLNAFSAKHRTEREFHPPTRVGPFRISQVVP